MSLFWCMVLESVLVSSFTSGWPVLPAPLVKEIVFSPLYILAPFVKDKVSIGVWIYLGAFYFVPLIYIPVFVPVPYCLDDCGFVTQNPPQLPHFTLSKSQRLTWPGCTSSLTASSTLQLAWCFSATWVSLPLQGHSRHILSSGVFHWLFLLPGTRSAGICMTSSYTSITLFKCHLLSKACQKHPNFKLQSSPVHPISLPLLCSIAHKTTYSSIHPPTIYPMYHTYHSTRKSVPWKQRCFPLLFTAVSLELRNIVTLMKSSWIKWKNLTDVKMRSNITMNEKFFILTSNELFLLENLDRCLKTFIWRVRIYILPNTMWGTKVQIWTRKILSS